MFGKCYRLGRGSIDRGVGRGGRHRSCWAGVGFSCAAVWTWAHRADRRLVGLVLPTVPKFAAWGLVPAGRGATPWPWPRQPLTGQDLRLATPPYGNRGKGLVGFLFCCGFAAKIASSKCFPGKVRRGGRVGGPFLAKQCWPRLVVVLVACKAPNALSFWVRCWLIFGFWFGFWVGCVLSIDSFGQILSGVCVC